MGNWWLVIYALGWLMIPAPMYSYILAPQTYRGNLQPFAVFISAFGTWIILVGLPLTWSIAALVLVRASGTLLNSVPIPRNRVFASIQFRLACIQGVKLIVVGVLGSAFYALVTIHSSQFDPSPFSLPAAISIQGFLHLLFWQSVVMIWGIAILSLTKSLPAFVGWNIVCIFSLKFLAYYNIFPDIDLLRYKATWELSVFFILAALLVPCLFYWRLPMFRLAYFLIILPCLLVQHWLQGVFLLPLCLLSGNPLFSKLLNSFGFETGPGFHYSYLGPGYVTNGGGYRDLKEFDILNSIEPDIFRDMLLLLTVVSINLILVIGQYYICHYVIKQRERKL